MLQSEGIEFNEEKSQSKGGQIKKKFFFDLTSTSTVLEYCTAQNKMRINSHND